MSGQQSNYRPNNKNLKLPPKTPPPSSLSESDKSTPLDSLAKSGFAKQILNDPLATDIWRLYTKSTRPFARWKENRKFNMEKDGN